MGGRPSGRRGSALEHLFHPSSVAVIGASKTEGKIGHAILKNVLDSGYRGPVYPVNPKEEEILGLKCYPSVAAVPEPVGLAVVAVPAKAALTVVRECGEAGVPCLVVVTAGFREVGKEGLALEKDLVETCRRYGMTMVGPNCLGIMGTHTPLNASFSAGFPHRGDIAFLSQSGALCAAILDWSLERGIGFSKFVSLGNKAVLDELDFIRDAAEDDYSKVILGYIEDVKRGEEFVDEASRAARKKPVVIIKSGTSQAGAKAASSHTGALAGSDLAYDVAFRQAGIIRAATMEELFDYATAFATQPIPKGRRVAIVTNSGGPGIIATDQVEARGLTMAGFSKKTLEELRGVLPPAANIYNPVDVLGDATAEVYRNAFRLVLADPGVDAVVCLLTRPAGIDPAEVARGIIEERKRFPAKPVVAAFLGGENVREANEILEQAGLPSYEFPERAVMALSGLVRYGELMKRPPVGRGAVFDDVDRDKVREIFAAVKSKRRLVLLGSEAHRVAEAYGIPAAPIDLAVRVSEAVETADRLGYPVVLKVASPKITHKSDVGGVKVGLEDAAAVREGFLGILESVHRVLPQVPVEGVEVQKMMPGGTEFIVGVSRDVQFGPLVMFGLGGIWVNLIKDVSFRLAKGLTMDEIERMILETKANTLLRGYRGRPPLDAAAVAETIARVAQLVRDFPEISELDINPLVAYEKGVCALDVKMTIS
ncbi:MAG TPA: acyl-CoA synthetase [Clostridiales bacterium]|nr:acyl-CoA synthetase [Clostridiales bacterium]